MTPATIIIVDDHAPSRAALAALLTRRLNVGRVITRPAAAGIVAHCRAEPPDLVIIDIQLDDRQDGLGLALELRIACPAVPLLLLSSHQSERVMETAMAAGVCGYVPKVGSGDTLMAAIRSVLAGQTAYQKGPGLPGGTSTATPASRLERQLLDDTGRNTEQALKKPLGQV